MTDEIQSAEVTQPDATAIAEPSEKRTRRKTETAKVRLLRGYFPADGGDKIERGSLVDLPIDEARDVIRKGIGVNGAEL